MTFEYRDSHGRILSAVPDTDLDDKLGIALWSRGEYGVSVPVRVPLDRVEEVVAGIRDAARQAAGQTVCVHPDGYEGECPCTTGCVCCKPTPAADRHCACNHLRGQHNSACAHCPCVGFAETWPTQAAGQTPTTEPECLHPHCGSRSLPISTGEVVRCVLLAEHTGQCQSATEYPYVSWPNPSNGVWNTSHAPYEPTFRQQPRTIDAEPASVVGQPAEAQPTNRAEQYGQVLRRWGLLDEVNDPKATEEFAVTDLLAIADAERASLTAAERQFLTFALDLAFDEMTSRGDEFGYDDHVALARFRRMADEETH